MCRILFIPVLGILVTGCTMLAPVGSFVTAPRTGASPWQVYEQTTVNLAEDNFVLVKTNAGGQSRGFSLFGLITIYPATLTKAMSRMYAAAEMRPGQSQTTSHLVVEQSSSFFLLFGIPKIEVRADIVEFRPKSKTQQKPATPQAQRFGSGEEENRTATEISK